jgi:hypothetical protein
MSDDKQPGQTPPWIVDLYAEGNEQPPESLDAAVLREAQASIEQGKETNLQPSMLRRPWVGGLASAAVVLLTVTVMFVGSPDPDSVMPRSETLPSLNEAPLLEDEAAVQVTHEPMPQSQLMHRQQMSAEVQVEEKDDAAGRAFAKSSVQENIATADVEPAHMRLASADVQAVASLPSGFASCDSVSEGLCADDAALLIKSPTCMPDYRLPAAARVERVGLVDTTYRLDGQVWRVACIAGEWQLQEHDN